MHLKYRPEIDGLRAVSVIMVILFHLGITLMPGGFIGVDVFFVISGFLITSIITKECASNTFTFADFYKRRVLRLAPAYLSVIVVTTLVSFFVMLPAELVNYLESVIYSTFFVANFYMWDNVGGYFAVNSDTVPLLHLWSLGIEEQFYFIWPAAFLLLSKFVRKHLIWLVAVIVIASVFVSQWGVENYKAAAYYLLPTRAFELLIGAFVALLPPFKTNVYIKNIMSAIGLAVIIYCAVTYSEDIYFPGINALWPCLGAALLLYFAQGDKNAVVKFLSLPAMTWAGKFSYPAYLWHWPIIAFAHVYLVEVTFFVGSAIFVLAFVLSAITYFALEKPSQHFKRRKPSAVIVFGFLIPAMLLTGVSALGIQSKGWPQRISKELRVKSEAVLSDSNEIRGRCNQGPILNPLPASKCVLGESDNPEISTLLIGDSHANHFTGFIDVLLKDANLRGYDITQSSTIFLPDVHSYSVIESDFDEYENFIKRNAVLKDIIHASSYRYVVLGGAFAYHLNNGLWSESFDKELNKEVFYDAFRRAVQEIKSSGAIPIILEGNPQFSSNLSSCTLNNLRFNLNATCTLPIKEHESYFNDWLLFLKKLKLENPELVVIKVAQIMCDSHDCKSDIEGVPLYADGGHLNYQGSVKLGELYLQLAENPFIDMNELNDEK